MGSASTRLPRFHALTPMQSSQRTTPCSRQRAALNAATPNRPFLPDTCVWHVARGTGRPCRTRRQGGEESLPLWQLLAWLYEQQVRPYRAD